MFRFDGTFAERLNISQGKNRGDMYISVYVTASSVEEAEMIGSAMVRERLAACANIIPEIVSIYRWEGKVEKDRETLMFLKTKKEKVPELVKRIKELHSYEVPAILTLHILDGNMDYLRWVDEETGPS
jgi:periplasmic divalent cation tolerance protein